MLENVDRLLKSPASQRGRDFAIMLSSLNALGYAVEWRVINAADYGMPQRRRRVFLLGYHKSSELYEQLKTRNTSADWLTSSGIVASAFTVKETAQTPFSDDIDSDLKKLSDDFNKEGKLSPFLNTGLMVDGKFWTLKTEADYNREQTVLEDILEPNSKIPKIFISRRS